jgi:lipopolysaccharide transport system permease protein
MYQLIHYRDLLANLIARQVKIHYRRSILGILWSLLNPLLALLVFVFIFQQVLPLNIPHYASYVFCGLLAWSWFSTSLSSAAYTIVFSRELVRRPGFNPEVLVAVNIGSNMVTFLLALPILLGLLWTDGLFPTLSYLLFPVMLLLQFAFTLGISLIVAALNVHFRDIGHLTSALVVIWFYITPVFYQARVSQKDFEWVFLINPMTHLLDAYRKILIEGRIPDPMPLLIITLISLVVCAAGFGIFRVLKHTFVDEL